MNWFKLHHEARNDKKLRSLTPVQHLIWFNLLCFASEQEVRGVIEYDDFDLLALEVSDNDTETLTETLALLVRMKIVENDGETISFLKWEKRQQAQYAKPSDEPANVNARVKRHREKIAEARNAPVTPETPNNARLDKIREEKNPPNPPQAGGVAARPEISPNEGEAPELREGEDTKAAKASARERNASARASARQEKSDQTEAFGKVWELWLKKVDRADALAAWLKLNPSLALAQCIAAAAVAQCKNPRWHEENRRFCPHFATWLNKRRWEDEPDFALTPPDVPPPKAPYVFANPPPPKDWMSIPNMAERAAAREQYQAHQAEKERAWREGRL